MRDLRFVNPRWVVVRRIAPRSSGTVLLPEALLADRTQRAEVGVLVRDSEDPALRAEGLLAGALVGYQGYLRYASPIGDILAPEGGRSATRVDDLFMLRREDILFTLQDVQGSAVFGEYGEFPADVLRAAQRACIGPGRRLGLDGQPLSRLEFRMRVSAFRWTRSQPRGVVSTRLQEEVARMARTGESLSLYLPLDAEMFHSDSDMFRTPGRRDISWYLWVPTASKESLDMKLRAERSKTTLTKLMLAALWRVWRATQEEETA